MNNIKNEEEKRKDKIELFQRHGAGEEYWKFLGRIKLEMNMYTLEQKKQYERDNMEDT